MTETEKKGGVRYVRPPNLWLDGTFKEPDEQKVLAAEVAALMVDNDMLDLDSIEAQTTEMESWPWRTLDIMKRGIMEKKVTSRNIGEIAAKEKTETQNAKIEAQHFPILDTTWTAEEVARDFGENFIKLSCGDDVLQAALVNESIDKLEEMASVAHRELLRARRKSFLLNKAVDKAHRLLEGRALEFMDQPHDK